MEAGSSEINELKRTISRFITPHAVVFSTKKVKQMFVRYGLTPAEFLRPFGVYNGVTYFNPFPDATASNSVEVVDLRLEFYDFESMHGFDDAYKVIEHILQNYKPKIELEGKDWSDKKNIESELLDPVTYNSQWYKKWEECFLDQCKFASHELIDQPLLFFYLVSAEDADADKEIQDMCNSKSTIKRYREGTYDGDFPHIYIMLHDKKHEVTFDVATLKLEKLKKKYARGFNH